VPTTNIESMLDPQPPHREDDDGARAGGTRVTRLRHADSGRALSRNALEFGDHALLGRVVEGRAVALDVLKGLSLEVVNADREAMRIEAVVTTFLFGFKDDVVVRIRPGAAGGSRVDVRSASRVGQSDLGANAARIGRILEGLRST
jgi:hypothetical protein